MAEIRTGFYKTLGLKEKTKRYIKRIIVCEITCKEAILLVIKIVPVNLDEVILSSMVGSIYQTP